MSTIITRNSANSGSTPASLVQGELAINVTDNRLFFGSGSGNVVKEFGVTSSYALQALSASYAVSASYEINYETSSSYADFAVSASHALTASFVTASNVYGPYGSNSVISASYASASSFSDRTAQIDVYVKNQSGNNIAKGVVVRITGSNTSSDIPRIVTASYENDNNSANTLGITTTAIANGAEGYVITEGILTGIDTQAFTSGQLIYLGPTGSIIGYAPVAPLHSVRLGEVIRHQSNNGSIYVRIDNGYEIEELHDVLITSASSGDLLIRSASVWINSKQLSGSYSLTGSLTISGSSTFTNIGPAIFSGSVTSIGGFTGSLLGTATTASYVLNAVSASYAPNTTFPYTGSAIISGSLIVTGSIAQNASTASFGGVVGIGTTTPAYTLDVNGTARVSGQITTTTANAQFGTIGASTGNFRIDGVNGADFAFAVYSSNTLRFGVVGFGGISMPSGFTIVSSLTDLTTTRLRIGTSNATAPINIQAQPGNTDMIVLKASSGVDLFTIKQSTGNALIGTSTDAGFKLDVNGTARVSGNATFFSTGNAINVRNNSSINFLYSNNSSNGFYLTQNSSNTFSLGNGNYGYSILTCPDVAAASARIGIGVNITSVNASSVLDLQSTTQGFLPPRTNLTSNISTPAQGLMTYITASATEGLYYYSSGSIKSWTRLLNDTGSQSIYGSLGINRTSTASLDVAGTTRISGSFNTATSGSILTVIGSGSAQPILLVTGSTGQLFSVTDTNSGSLLQIYDDSSNSIFEITSDAEVKYGVSSSIFASKLTPILSSSSYVTIYNIETGSYTGAFINYTVTSASNARAGQLMSVWNNGTANYTEVTTTDIGNTSEISFAVIITGSSANIAVSSSLTTGWQVKTALNII